MPVATASTASVVRKELKSCPGGFVVLRRLTFGEKLQRRAMTSSLKFDADSKSKSMQGEMQMVNEEATLFDFARCVVEHNLEKEVSAPTAENPDAKQVVLLDLRSKADIALLDPRVGEEIDTYLSELNNFEDDEGN